MNPYYRTIHKAPMDKVILGIMMDLPRYYKDKEVKIINRKPAAGRARTPYALALQTKMMEIIQRDGKATTKELVKALQSNRYTIYQNCIVLQEDEKIKLVKTGEKMFHWEVVS